MNTQEKSTWKNVIAIIGFIILLIVGIWSAIQVIKFVPRLFSDTGTTPTTTTDSGIELGGRDIIAVLSTATANSGEPVLLEFAHSGDDEGILSFSYACNEGFYFEVAGRPIPCNAPYGLPVTSTSLELIPFSAKQSVDAPLAVTYTNADGESVRDTKTLTVVNTAVTEEGEANESTTSGETTKEGTISGGPVEPDSVIATPTHTTPTRTTNTTPTPRTVIQTVRVPRTSNPYGVADLKVEMVGIGDINPYGAFEPKSVVHNYARGAVKFKVTNLGDKQTGEWFFSTILPTRGGYPFTSRAQPSLMPGSSTEIFMTFDQLVPGVHTFTVHVDPLNYIPELSEYNNSTSQALTVLNY